jgi:hypothetical protein
MKQFMAIYLGSPGARAEWNALSEGERKQREATGMQQWRDWATRNGSSIVDGGGPLGKTKRADKGGIADVRNSMAAYVIVRAESHEAAAALFKNHPHFTVFPGEAVEIMECLPVPAAAR